MDQGGKGLAQVVLIDKDLYNPYEIHGPPTDSDEARIVWLLEDGVQITERPLSPDCDLIEIKGDEENLHVRRQLLQLACMRPHALSQVERTGHALEHLGYNPGEIAVTLFAIGLAFGDDGGCSHEVLEQVEAHYARLEELLAELGAEPTLNISPEDFEI